jgi:hypothetical protein
MKPETAAQSTGFFVPGLRLSELRLGGHKKARLQVQPGFFRDPVGIRTPNLLIRSEVLYPVELQSRSTLTLR